MESSDEFESDPSDYSSCSSSSEYSDSDSSSSSSSTIIIKKEEKNGANIMDLYNKLFKTEFEPITMTKIKKEKAFKCDLCTKSYVNKGSLRDHVQKHHLKIKNYECSICKKGFFDKYQWREHSKMHKRRESKQCTLCDAVFLYEAKWYKLNSFFINNNSFF